MNNRSIPIQRDFKVDAAVTALRRRNTAQPLPDFYATRRGGIVSRHIVAQACQRKKLQSALQTKRVSLAKIPTLGGFANA